MADISRQELWEFLTEAELNTWVSGKNKVETPTIDDSKQYVYRRDDWLYLDTYFTTEDERSFWGFEVVYYLSKQERKYKKVMVRQYGGKLSNRVKLEKTDILYGHLRSFRGRWLELPFADRQGKVVLQNDPWEGDDSSKALSLLYRRSTFTDAEGRLSQEETLEVASEIVLRHQFTMVMMAELTS